LAREVEDILRGGRSCGDSAEATPALSEAELEALMRVARDRLESASDSAQAALQYEGIVWQKVIEKIDGRRAASPRSTAEPPEFNPGWADPHTEAEVGDIIRQRRLLANELFSIAEGHRDEVWKKVSARLEPRPSRGVWRFFERRSGAADGLAPGLDATARGEAIAASGDPFVDDLIRIAQARKALSKFATDVSAESQARTWTRIEHKISRQSRHHDQEPARPSRGIVMSYRLAGAAALVALFAAAVGPIPATGIAGHPAVGLVNYAGGHLGIRESDTAPPTAPGDALEVDGVEASAGEASELLGFAVQELSESPNDYTLRSSRYYNVPITADSGGVFVSIYQGNAIGSSELAIYQERAFGAEITAAGGAVFDVALSDGTEASYVNGAWEAGAAGFAWLDGESQTLVFDRDGSRTIIRYSGPSTDPALLLSVANQLDAAGD